MSALRPYETVRFAQIAAVRDAFSALQNRAIGLAWNSVGAPIINASRMAGQNASRIGLAKALTGEPSDALKAALMKREADRAVPPLVAEQTKRLTQALMRAAIVSAPAGQRYFGAQ